MAKNASGAGSIRQRADGRWEARYSAGFNPATGRQIQRSIYGKTQKEVRQKLNKVISDLDSGTYVAPSNITVSQWLQLWLAEYLTNVKPHTRKAYEDRLRLHVIPELGFVKLSELQPPMVQRFINKLSIKLSPKTVKNVHGVFHSSLTQAVLNGYIHKNPADHCVLPKITKPNINPLDDKTILDFIKIIEGDRYELLYLITLFTGLRQGEVLGLTWDCIDWDKSTLRISSQLQQEKKAGGKYYLTTLKNGKPRTICLAPFVLDLFRKRSDQQNQERVNAYDLWSEDIPGLIFENLTGGHLSHASVREHFKHLVRKIGLPNMRFHDLRHSFATISLRNGDDIKTVQENLGHATSSFTLDVYGHVTNHMRQESAQRLEKYISKLK